MNWLIRYKPGKKDRYQVGYFMPVNNQGRHESDPPYTITWDWVTFADDLERGDAVFLVHNLNGGH